MAMVPFLPDSPRLLIRKERHEEALEVLAALQGHGATPDTPSVRAQYGVIKDVIDKVPRSRPIRDFDKFPDSPNCRNTPSVIRGGSS